MAVCLDFTWSLGLGYVIVLLVFLCEGFVSTTSDSDGNWTLPRRLQSQYHKEMACDLWPQKTSFQKLKSLLGNAMYSNLAIDCRSQQTLKIITSLLIKNHPVSPLDIPRVNIIFIDAEHSLKYDQRSLISKITNIKTNASHKQFPPCRKCCVRGDVIVSELTTSNSRTVATLLETCTLKVKSRTSCMKHDLHSGNPLNGLHLLVASAKYFPFSTLHLINSSLVLGGYCSEILNLLAAHFNFTYTILDSVDGSFGGRDKTTGRWSGLVGMILRREADMIFTGLTINKARSEVVDFTYPFWEEPSSIIVRISDHKETYFYKPLQWKVWLATFGCVVVTTLITWLYDCGSTRARKITQKTLQNSPLTLVFMTMISTSVLKGADKLIESRPSRVLWLVFWLVSLVIVTTYTGNLVAALATQHVKLPFRTLAELAEDKEYSLLVLNGSAQMTLLQEAKGNVFAKLWEKVQSHKSIIMNGYLAYHLVLNSSRPLAIIGDRIGGEQYLFDIKRCEWRHIPQTFFPSGFGIALPKGSPYTDIISKRMIQMAQHGLFKHWEEVHFIPSPCEVGKSYSSGPILLSHVWLLFMVLGVGLVLCCGLLCAERCFANMRNIRK